MDKKKTADVQGAIGFFKGMGLGKDVLDLVRADLEAGLTKEEVTIYAQSRMDLEHMKMCSKCFREQIDKSVIKIITDERLDVSNMELFYDAYKNGVTKNVLLRILNKESKDYRKAIERAMPKKEPEKIVIESDMSQDVIGTGRMYYLVPVEGIPKTKPMTVEREKLSENRFISLVKKIFMFRRSNRDLVSKVINKELNKEQLEQIKIGISKGLTESQLVALINSNAEAERMEQIIEIAVLENAL